MQPHRIFILTGLLCATANSINGSSTVGFLGSRLVDFLQSETQSVISASDVLLPPQATPDYLVPGDLLANASLSVCPKDNQGPLVLDHSALLSRISSAKSVLTISYDHWWARPLTETPQDQAAQMQTSSTPDGPSSDTSSNPEGPSTSERILSTATSTSTPVGPGPGTSTSINPDPDIPGAADQTDTVRNDSNPEGPSTTERFLSTVTSTGTLDGPGPDTSTSSNPEPDIPGAADQTDTVRNDSNPESHSTSERILSTATSSQRVFRRVPLDTNVKQGAAYSFDGQRLDFTLEAVLVFAPSIHTHDFGLPLSLEVQFEHRAAEGTSHDIDLEQGPSGLVISTDGKVLSVDTRSAAFEEGVQAGWTIMEVNGEKYKADLAPAMYQQMSFHPGEGGLKINKQNGEVLEVKTGTQGSKLGVKAGWQIAYVDEATYEQSLDETLLVSETGTWIHSDEKKSIFFKVPRMEAGSWILDTTTTVTFRAPPQVLGLSLLFREGEAGQELELLRWLNNSLRPPGQRGARPFNASTLVPRFDSTEAVTYKAGAALPPCSNDMLWFVTTEVLQVPQALLRDIKASLKKDPIVENITARLWNGAAEEQVKVVHLQEAKHPYLDLGWAKEEMDDRRWYFGCQFAAATAFLILYTSSIFFCNFKRSCPAAPSTMLLLLTTDRWSSIFLRMLIRSLVYVFFMVIFVLPVLNYQHAQCRTGYPWEVHVKFFYFLIFTRTLEITMIAIVGVNSRYSCWVKFKLYVCTVFKQMISILAATDMYTDANFVLIAYACQWDWWVLALLTFVVGVLIFQSAPKWMMGMYFMVRGFKNEQDRLNEMMAWCKLLHMENLVQYMGANLVADDVEEQAGVYVKPVYKEVEFPFRADHTQAGPLMALLRSEGQMKDMMDVRFEDYSLHDRQKMRYDVDYLRNAAESATRTREERYHPAAPPSEPREPDKPSEPAPGKSRFGLGWLTGRSARQSQAQEENRDLLRRSQQDQYEQRYQQYQIDLEKFKKDKQEHEKNERQKEADLRDFEEELKTHLKLFDAYKDLASGFSTALQEMEREEDLKKQMEDIKLKVNAADTGLRCVCEDLFQAALQILYTWTFKWNTMVVISIGVGFSISFANVLAASCELFVKHPELQPCCNQE